MSAEDDEAALSALAEAYERALALEKAGDAGASAAWREVLALDPEDRGGAAVRLAALGAASAPERASPAYVATLFDQHAEAFEDILVGRLGYRVPEALADRLRARLPAEARLRVLDLGCGTGLAVAALGPLAAEATGVDLSEEMLGIAHDKGLYDALYLDDAVGFLVADPDDPGAPAVDSDGDPLGPWDLIVAADVLPYLGDVTPLAVAAARRLAPGGRLALSCESPPEGTDVDARGWIVGPHQRFHHADRHLEAAVVAAGLVVELLEPWTIRTNEGRPEPGRLMLAVKPR
ncbi:MAG: methyltransferase domain-containing protein [Paracoccaceae bacterium]